MAGRPKRRARLLAEGKLAEGNRGDRGGNGRKLVNGNRPEGASSTNSGGDQRYLPGDNLSRAELVGESNGTPDPMVTPARASGLPSPGERLDIVIGMKLNGQWKHWDSVRQLCEQWDCHRQHVETASAEADRCIARIFACDDPARIEERRALVLANIESELRYQQGTKNRATVPQLLKLQAAILGVLAPIKHLVAHVNGEAAKLSNAELVAEILKSDPAALEQTRALILGGKDVVTVPAEEPAKEMSER